MTWTKLDDHFPDHPKILAAGPTAELLHIHALIYCNKHLTDGFLPSDAVKRLIHVNARGPAERLVDLGLWEKVVGGYQIHDFLEWNPSREKVLAERARSAARQAKSRVSNAVTTPVTNGVTSPEVREKFSGPVPSRPEPFNASSVGSTSPEPGLDLAVSIAEVLGVATLAPLEIQACEQALIEFPYLIPAELVERAREHQKVCAEKNYPLARTVQGLWSTWRSQNDYNADHGRQKPRSQTVGAMTRAFTNG